MNLPRPGAYEGHASWTGRDAAAAYYNASLQRAAGEQWTPDRIGASWQQCPAAEQYTLDLWFARESGPEDEDDDQPSGPLRGMTNGWARAPLPP
ncbi:hypothetical protein [Streptomyces sp. NBC_01233]|uniref:hypothetical protein n=1 Tax=Streptomyces sp. NBC_01233 TaxID=2903787 RepID=UPI002E0FB8BD|nr:hypothetical protein OG332_03410 [Streptomyces sp. NBC_01233]